MFNLMYKLIMEKKDVALSLIQFEKTNHNAFKVYYGGVFLSRQSLICLNQKVLKKLYDMSVFSFVSNNYQPDFFQLSYSGLVASLRFMLKQFLDTLDPDDEFDNLTYKNYIEVLEDE